MRILGFEKFSMVDYQDKITCTVFTDKCNLRCPFCHNASLVLGQEAIGLSEGEVFDYLELRRRLVDAVCISGGEPTLQPDLAAFASRVKAMGYLVKLDTNGTMPKVIKKLIEDKLVDYVAMDIKNSRENYLEITGMTSLDLASIEESVCLLMSSGIDYEFRTTLVSQYHSREDVTSIAHWLRGAKRYYLQKFVDRGSCIAENLTEVPIDTAKEYLDIVKDSVLLAELRGY